jgi:hypothetical protein
MISDKRWTELCLGFAFICAGMTTAFGLYGFGLFLVAIGAFLVWPGPTRPAEKLPASEETAP